MRRPAPVVLLVSLVLLGASTGAGAAAPPVRIVAVAPNPVATDDVGESVEVSFPVPTNVTGWSVDDGETVARLPNRTLHGRVILTADPEHVTRRVGNSSTVDDAENTTVVGLSGRLALSNAGETIHLRTGSNALVSVTYSDAPEGRRYVRTERGWAWRRPGVTDLPVVSDTTVPATAFVLPDDPGPPVAAIEGASDRVLLAAYTFSSRRAAGALCRAARRGVDVRVLVEREPVGGMSRRSADTLDRLVDCGVAVSAIGGPGDRYGVHHPKYVVVDERAVVLSENWKPAGTGGRSSRGWGVVVESSRLAGALATTFEADTGFRDVAPWSRVRPGLDLVVEPSANGSYPRLVEPESIGVDRASVLVAPDNAEPKLVALIDGAERSVDVQQVSIGGRDDPLLNATVEAARRGVPVRVLLSGAWYVREENRRLVRWLDERAREEGLPLRARLVEPRSRFEKAHVKGLIVDGESVVVGSLNWNRHATRRNREVVVVLHDEAAAGYYLGVFEADWRGGDWRLPATFGLLALVASAVAAVHRYRRSRFDGGAAGENQIVPEDGQFAS